jgi:septum formation protein
LFCKFGAQAATAILFRFDPIELAMKLVLASASARRAEILAAAGIPFEMRTALVDESRLAHESAAQMIERLAREKASAVARNGNLLGPHIILGADTVVVADEEILGKPGSAAAACHMLRKLQGREHLVLTGFVLLRTQDGQIRAGSETTRVWFSEMTEAEIDAYAATNEPLDKAGAYAIQGFAGRYIPRIEGCYFNVVGLPLARIWQALKELGWPDS